MEPSPKGEADPKRSDVKKWKQSLSRSRPAKFLEEVQGPTPFRAFTRSTDQRVVANNLRTWTQGAGYECEGNCTV